MNYFYENGDKLRTVGLEEEYIDSLYDPDNDEFYENGDDLNTFDRKGPKKFASDEAEAPDFSYSDNIYDGTELGMFMRGGPPKKALTLKQCAELFSRLQSNDKSVRAKAQQEFVVQHQCYVQQMLLKTFPTFARSPHFADIVQATWEKIWIELPTYDPAKGSFSNFLYPRIIGAGSAYITELNETTQYFAAKERKVARAYDALVNSGIHSPSPDEIARLSGLRVSTVEKILSKNSSISLEGNEDKVADTRETPEKAIVEKEQYADLYAAIKELPTIEQQVLTMLYGLQGTRSYTKREIADSLSIPKDTVSDALDSARSHLRLNARFRKSFSDRDKIQRSLGAQPVCFEPVDAAQIMFEAICEFEFLSEDTDSNIGSTTITSTFDDTNLDELPI